MRILGFGDSTCDINLDTGIMYPGGQSLNVAVNASFCGAEAAYMGCMGNDKVAEHILHTLDILGVDHSRCRTYPVPNEYWLYRDINGDRVFLPANQLGKSPLTSAVRDMLCFEGLSSADMEYIQTFDIVHTSEVSRIEPLLPKLRELNVYISFDFSLKYQDVEYYQKICKYADIVLISCSEKSKEETIKWLKMAYVSGAKVAIATRGSSSTLCFDGMNIYEQKPITAKQLIDTLGAGDAFFGSFLASYLSENPDMRQDKNAVIQKSLLLASTHAASICSVSGSFGHGIEYKRRYEV